MAIPGGRRIVLGDVTYTWSVSPNHRDRFGTGWTAPSMKLTVRNGETGKFTQYNCKSLKWTSEHASIYFDDEHTGPAEPHKVTFTPSVVSTVIRLGKFPATVQDWEVSRL